MKKDKLKRLLKGMGNGIKDAIPIVASLNDNILTPHQRSANDPMKGAGKIDWIRLITSVTTVGAALGWLSGKLSVEDIKQILAIIGR